MPKTVQIRNLDDKVYPVLQSRAAAAGISVPELLRRELTRIAARPSMKEWLDVVSRLPRLDYSDIDINQTLDEMRGAWPDDDR